MCTVPNTYREEMDRQTSHPSCGFYAASYVLNCFNPDAAWTNMELLKLAVQYPLTNRAEGCLSEVGEVFHPHDFARFIHARANGSCSAACQLFHEQTIRDPYFTEGPQSQNAAHALARHENTCALEDVCARYLSCSAFIFS